MKNLLCGKCQEAGLKSILREHGGTKTLMGTSGYYDEEGGYHYHDPNDINNHLTCSNNHSFMLLSKSQCPNEKCDFGKEKPIIVWLDDLIEGNLYYNKDSPTIEKYQG